ncbi:hypothetical protein [Estrella lausannensis]|uniref:N-acetyltransferase domain-containing protein n=1 Tax=Estrella lausannensis TaxID=483423 RepID=A0A0H5DNA2_9BACT|nr:hypothetical protein [Estrella lausannensis]CRX37766.1 Conserved hypothetical protein [Estrella lausannensis]
MINIEEVDLKALKHPLLSAVRTHLPAELTSFCEPGKDRKEKKAPLPLLAVAIDHGQLAGFAFALYYRQLHLADLSLVYVSDQKPFGEVAELLLSFLEARLYAEGCLVIEHHYAKEEGSPDLGLETELYRRGWGHKTLIHTRYYFDCYAFKPKWFTTHHPLPDGFSLKPWKTIDASEKLKIRLLQEQFTFHPFISPLEDESHIQEINSLALLHGDEVIGWMVTHTHPDDPQLIRYSSLYVKPEFLAKGVAAPLLQESILRQQRSPLRWSFFQVTWSFTDQRWIRFIDKRLKGQTSRIVHYARLSKGLR